MSLAVIGFRKRKKAGRRRIEYWDDYGLGWFLKIGGDIGRKKRFNRCGKDGERRKKERKKNLI
jgi:hypothetical protein